MNKLIAFRWTCAESWTSLESKFVRLAMLGFAEKLYNFSRSTVLLKKGWLRPGAFAC
jgi:hypothetical protein